MTDQPKRRGRPPKKWADDPWSAMPRPTDQQVAAFVQGFLNIVVDGAMPTPRLRHKPGAGLQQAWQHATGLEWRPVPTVAADAADWEDG